MKTVLVSIVTAILIVTTSFVGIGGLNDNKAEAAGLLLEKHGYFSNYVYSQTDKTSSKGNTLSGWVNSDSKASGYYTLTVQKSTSSGWKTVKSISAKRNGTTDFDIYVSKNTTYRFKLSNTGSKTRVNYDLYWMPN